MNKYESVVIINPSVDEEGVKELVKKFTDLINTDGKVEKVDNLGKKKLAYEIQKMSEAYYYFITIDTDNTEFPSELDSQLRIMEPVIRYLVVKPEAETEAPVAEEAAPAEEKAE